MVQAVRLVVLEMSENAFPRVLGRTGLLERVLTAQDLKESVTATEVHCYIEILRVEVGASMSV